MCTFSTAVVASCSKWTIPRNWRTKQQQVRDALTKIAGLEDVDISPTLPAEPHYNYRNKVEFTFSNKRWLTPEEIAKPKDYDRRALGFHVPRHFDKVLDINECHLHEDRLNALRNAIREYAREHELSFFDIRAQEGFLRNLVIRTSVTTGEVLIMLIVFEDRPGLVQQLFTHLAERFDFVTDWLWLHNAKKNDSYSELAPQVWRGEGFITEQLGEYTFKISPTSFFQTNTHQGLRLYDIVRAFAGEGQTAPVDLLYDLYCGTGTIGIFCEALAERVVGIEYNQASVDDAAENAALNKLSDKMSFHAGDMAKLLTPSFFQEHGRPQTLIADPPRAGMGDKVCQRILEAAPQRIVYVSCKPSTQARDLEQLLPAYTVTRVQPVDMFPHTPHVENVVLLERRP